MEKWRDVIGFDGLYLVSDKGNVKSTRFNKLKMLKPYKRKDGYELVSLYKDGLKSIRLIHQLVAESFLNHFCGGDLVIDHINDNPSDNRLENLQIVSQRFNVCKTQGKYASKFKGVYRSQSKWKSQIVIDKKIVYLGTFDCEFKAHLAYESKLRKLILKPVKPMTDKEHKSLRINAYKPVK